MSEPKKGQKGQINIELDAAIAEGIYSNLAIINHSVSEFVVDFVNIMPGVPKNKVKSRIILTPQHAKRLTKAWVTMSNVLNKHTVRSKTTNSRQCPLILGLLVRHK